MAAAAPLTSDVTLRYRAPCDIPALIDFLARRAVPGVEEVVDGVYRRSLLLAHGAAVVSLAPADGTLTARLSLADARDLGPAVARCRRLLDLDTDPAPILQTLGEDPLIGHLVHRAPGRRVPGSVDEDELAIRAVLGQQVSLRGAATLAGRLVEKHGERLERPHGSVTHLFPSAAALADTDPDTLAMPRQRRRALLGLAGALADGDVDLRGGSSSDELTRRLRALPGIGPWTIGYITMRALGAPTPSCPPTSGSATPSGFSAPTTDRPRHCGRQSGGARTARTPPSTCGRTLPGRAKRTARRGCERLRRPSLGRRRNLLGVSRNRCSALFVV